MKKDIGQHSAQRDAGRVTNTIFTLLISFRSLTPGFFWTFAKKLKVKKTKTQAQKTQNSRIFHPKLKIPANVSEI